MIKKISASILLAFIAGNSFAMQCPVASDWIHEKGKPWTLSIKAQAQGWKPMFKLLNDESELTTLPANAPLLVAVSNWNSNIFPGFYYASCDYTSTARSSLPLMAINDSDLPVNMKTLDYKHFHRDLNSYICNTTADKSSECTWESLEK